MTRRIGLFVGTFVVLLAAFLGYYHTHRQEARRPRTWPFTPPPTRAGGRPVKVEGRDVEAEPGENLRIVQYDRRHRLRAKVLARYWEKVGEEFRLKEPSLEWYPGRGEVVTIRAQRGIVRAREVAGRWILIEGELIGDVCITLDPAGAMPAGQARKGGIGVIRIFVDDVRFDRDALLIRSDSYVSIFAAEADVLGRGLRISWSEEPRQLREIRIVHGEYMCIRQGQERFTRNLSLSGVGARPAGGSGPRGPAAVPTSRPGPSPPTRSARLAPATLPATASAPAGPPVVPDTYVALFAGEVSVTAGARHLKGAEELELVFEYEPPSRDERLAETSRTRPAGPPKRKDKPAPGAAPAEPLFVTWTGPLVIKPFRSAEPYVPGRLDVTARGPELDLADGQTLAACGAIEFHSPGEQGSLVRGQAAPVRLQMAAGERLTADRVRFDRPQGVVKLDGAGTMHFPPRASGRTTGVEAGELDVRWGRGVEIHAGQRDSQQTPAGGRREYLTSAEFAGKVHVRQGAGQTLQAETVGLDFHRPARPHDPSNRPARLRARGQVHLHDARSGDFIKAGKLDVEMSPLHEDEVYPAAASAEGNVAGRQDRTEIVKAGKLTVTFAAEKDKTGKVQAKPRRLTAAEDVRIVDRRTKDAVTIVAETVATNLADRTAVLTGKPAKVTQKDNHVEGARILLDQINQKATVEGKGRLRFDTRTDMSGHRSESPRPWNITWTKGLKYRGQERRAVVDGNVDLKTAGDTVRCGRLRVLFAAPDKDKKDKSKPPATRKDDPLRFAPKEIATVLANDNVRMASERHDADGYLTRRVTLRSDKGQVAYETALLQLTCVGQGILVVEDYRQPAERPAKSAGPGGVIAGGDVDRPAQSVFAWSKFMELNQRDRIVRLDGEVTLARRSGQQMVLGDKLGIRPWRKKVPAGRKMRLTCERMLAEFAPPTDEKPAAAKDPLSGPRVGPLKLFHARAKADDAKDYVRAFNGPYEVVCRRILYERSRDVAVLFGSLENEPPRRAIVYEKNPARGTFRMLQESSKIVWRPSTNKFEAKGVKVTGGS